ncbi:MAG TPA: sulfite exporter TauE/SafE family protein [Candidatus Udaeobacter sp.]|nr:sulfite exporter TauE/SafE family protein [Candidatus Udaeobacter sp.]
MFFPISNSHINPIYLVVVGFIIGIFGGFFGVGGSFIAGPALRLMGVDWNYAVGTDLAHIVGKSIVAAKQHRALGNVDLKLGFLMAFGTIAGAECGAQLIQALKRTGNVNIVVSYVAIVVYFGIAVFMLWESRKTLRSAKGRSTRKGSGVKDDHSAFGPVTQKIQRLKIWPMITLPTSGIRISLWTILLVAYVGGVFSGFLGGGAGYIRMPSMVYVLGVPTHLAVGTDLFEIVISASYGTFTHAIKGNVDILIALVMHTGAVIGAQIGVVATQYFAGPKIRLAFVPLPLIGVAIVVYTLVTGHKL